MYRYEKNCVEEELYISGFEETTLGLTKELQNPSPFPS